MHLVQNIYRGRTENVHDNNGKYFPSNLILVLFTVCILYLSSVNSTDQSNWKNTVPKRNYTFSKLAPVYKPTSTSQRKSLQPQHQLNSTHNNLHHHQHHQHLQRFLNSEVISTAFTSSSPTISKPSSWYSSHSSFNSKMGSFSVDSTSSTSASVLPNASPTFQTILAKPESLSSLPSPLPFTSSSTVTSISSNSSNNISSIPLIKNSTSNKMESKKKKKMKQSKTKMAIDANTSSTNNSVTSKAVVADSNMELQEGTSRTLLMTPLMAYLFPVFIAQLFGMGMIPAAALITLPIFLLPLGIAAGVFLI